MAIELRPSQSLRLWQQVTLSQVTTGTHDLTMRQLAVRLHTRCAALQQSCT
jgi:hypothetical protein